MVVEGDGGVKAVRGQSVHRGAGAGREGAVVRWRLGLPGEGGGGLGSSA